MKLNVVVVSTILVGLAQDGLAWTPNLASSLKKPTASISRHRTVLSVVEEQKSSSSSSSSEDVTSAAFLEETQQKILGQPIPYSELTIGVLKETYPGENRVSQTPDSIRSLVKAGFTVVVQSGGK